MGIILVANHGARFLILALPGALSLLFFVFAGIRSVEPVCVSGRGISIPDNDGKLVPHAAVCAVEAQRGDDDARLGVAIHEMGHTHVVLLGLVEKDRVAAAGALTDAVAMHTGADAGSVTGNDTSNCDAFAPA